MLLSVKKKTPTDAYLIVITNIGTFYITTSDTTIYRKSQQLRQKYFMIIVIEKKQYHDIKEHKSFSEK